MAFRIRGFCSQLRLPFFILVEERSGNFSWLGGSPVSAEMDDILFADLSAAPRKIDEQKIDASGWRCPICDTGGRQGQSAFRLCKTCNEFSCGGSVSGVSFGRCEDCTVGMNKVDTHVPADWLLAIGTLHSVDASSGTIANGVMLAPGSEISLIDRLEKTTNGHTFVVAKRPSESTAEMSEALFSLRDSSGTVIWTSTGINMATPESGHVVVGDASIPKSLIAANTTLYLVLESSGKELAVLSLRSAALRVAMTNFLGASVAPVRPVVSEIPQVKSEFDQSAVHICEYLLAEWKELRDKRDTARLKIDAMKKPAAVSDVSTRRARQIIASLATGDPLWLTELDALLKAVRTNLTSWRQLFESVGNREERDKVVQLLREAVTIKAYYNLEGWGWLVDIAAVRERQRMIEKLLERHERYRLRT